MKSAAKAVQTTKTTQNILIALQRANSGNNNNKNNKNNKTYLHDPWRWVYDTWVSPVLRQPSWRHVVVRDVVIRHVVVREVAVLDVFVGLRDIYKANIGDSDVSIPPQNLETDTGDQNTVIVRTLDPVTTIRLIKKNDARSEGKWIRIKNTRFDLASCSSISQVKIYY